MREWIEIKSEKLQEKYKDIPIRQISYEKEPTMDLERELQDEVCKHADSK